MSLARSRRRRIEALQPLVDELNAADLRFFARHPHRRFRLQLAGHAEVEQHALTTEGHFRARPGTRLHTLVRRLPGMRLRLWLPMPEGVDVDRSEDELAAMWAGLSTPQLDAAVAMIEAGFGP